MITSTILESYLTNYFILCDLSVGEHPGGESSIWAFCGKDATPFYTPVRKHTLERLDDEFDGIPELWLGTIC